MILSRVVPLHMCIYFCSYSPSIEYVKLKKKRSYSIKTQRIENFHSLRFQCAMHNCYSYATTRQTELNHAHTHTHKYITDTDTVSEREAGWQRCCHCICAFPVSARMFRWSIFKCAVSVRLVSCSSVVQFGIRSLLALEEVLGWEQGVRSVLEEVGGNRKRNRPVARPFTWIRYVAFLQNWIQIHSFCIFGYSYTAPALA